MQIAMIGTGYVGLVSGACFSEFGIQVICVDKDAEKIECLKRGEIPIFEPGLQRTVDHNVAAGRLDFTTDLASAVGAADAVFIVVGTPNRHGDGYADLSYVYQAARERISATSTRRRGRSRPRSRAIPWWSPSRRCPWVPAPRWRGYSPKAGPMAISTWSQIRNSCAKAPPSATSCARTGW
jgi:threonine dehydrogenase-like Zn-dependent dehydrogenase